MMLLARLRDRCALLLRRRVPPTSSGQAARPLGRRSPRPGRSYGADAVLDVCLQSTSFICGVVVIVAVVYATHSPRWVVVDGPPPPPSPGCDRVRHLAAVEAASPRRTPDGERAGVAQVQWSNASAAGRRPSGGGCATGHTHVGAWTICAVYDNQLHGCGKR